MAGSRRKVAILGGGMGALAAAWELTRQPDWRERFEITVYQLGWRLGGKGASSRNPARGERIEEHGLHVWFGCYRNACRLLREAYAELERPDDHPLATVERAFRPQDRTPLGEFVGKEWRCWPVTFPRSAGEPGTGDEATVWQNIVNLLRHADRLFDDWCRRAGVAPPAPGRWASLFRLHHPAAGRVEGGYLRQCRRLAEAEAANPDRPYGRGVKKLVDAAHTWRHRQALLWRLRRFRRWGWTRASGEADDERRRLWIGIDLAVTGALGFLVDGVLFCGTDALDDEDLRDWLARHGASKDTIWSGAVRGLYDLCFAYENGDAGSGRPDDPGRPRFAAGAALEVALRIALTYSGSVCYELRAGMGEVVFAPLYLALRKRGVRFEFFHRVQKLELSPDGRSVAAIHMARQVRLRGDEYHPLRVVKGVECWRHAPDPAQIVDGERLRGVDLESPWSGWQDVEERVLRGGDEFDDVVLGISIAALPDICGELARRDRRWHRMFEHVRTVQTQSVQLWLTADLAALGWRRGPVPVNALPEPLDVWSDMSHQLVREAWPEGGPRSIQYLCGPLPGDWASSPTADRTVPQRAQAGVKRVATAWLEDHAACIWPSFAWGQLYDDVGRSGPDRLDAQVLRANINPSERYVLSVPGSTRRRLRPDGSGCDNLFLAGDWTYTPYNAGCIEAAALSGIAAAGAVGRRGGPAPSALASLVGLVVRAARRLLCLPFWLLRLVNRGIWALRRH